MSGSWPIKGDVGEKMAAERGLWWGVGGPEEIDLAAITSALNPLPTPALPLSLSTHTLTHAPTHTKTPTHTHTHYQTNTHSRTHSH